MKSPLFATSHSTMARYPPNRMHGGAPLNRTYGGAKPKLEGCANTDGGKTKRCSPVPFELNDRDGCTRSVDNNRCIARSAPRTCEFYQASKSSRCRISKNETNDNRCAISTKTGRCGLAKQPTSPKASRSTSPKASRSTSPRKSRSASPKTSSPTSKRPVDRPVSGGYVLY